MVFISLMIWTGFGLLYKREFNFRFPQKDLKNFYLAGKKFCAIFGYIVNGSVTVRVNGRE